MGYEVSLKAWRGSLKEVSLTDRDAEGSHDNPRLWLTHDWVCIHTQLPLLSRSIPNVQTALISCIVRRVA